MKKIMFALVGSLIGVASSYAAIDISIEAKSSWGINDPAIPGDTFDLSSGVLYQAFWSPDNAIDALDPLNPTVAQGNDKLLQSWLSTSVGIIDTVGGSYQSTDYGLASDGLVAGYVYLRVFNDAAPGVGTWYGESALVGGPLGDQSQASPPGPNTVDIAPDTLFTLNQQIVPEPTVLAFLGIGAALVAVRRMRRS